MFTCMYCTVVCLIKLLNRQLDTQDVIINYKLTLELKK